MKLAIAAEQRAAFDEVLRIGTYTTSAGSLSTGPPSGNLQAIGGCPDISGKSSLPWFRHDTVVRLERWWHHACEKDGGAFERAVGPIATADTPGF